MEHISIESFIPLIFLLFPLPFFKKWLGHVDPSKFAYGAVTAGVILTFYGIWIGLVGFNVDDIEASIPILLNGLKTSFSSSLIGLSTSLIINLFFVDNLKSEEKSLEEIHGQLKELNCSLNNFVNNSTDANITALTAALNHITESLELGINSETKITMQNFRSSVEIMCKWQKKYIDEINSIIEAMDKNALVTRETSVQLDKTNEALNQLQPVTETLAASIGWVQKALPSFRPKGISTQIAKDKKTEKE